MGTFVEVVKDGRFELCGRIIRDGDLLVVFIDGVGRFSIPAGVVTTIVMGLGDGEVSGPVSGVARLSTSGKGFYLDIGVDSYVIPVARVRAVMKGEHRKGPVSRVK